MKVCFFAKVRNKSYLERVEFYKQDIDILRDLGFTVVCSTNWAEIPSDADFFYIWWWTWAFLPLTTAVFNKSPALITGSFDHLRRDGSWQFDKRAFWHRGLISWALRRANANVFVSKLERERIPRLHRVTHPYYVPHIVDTISYRPVDVPREDIIFTIVWMQGENAERKCVPEIINAAKIVLDEYPEVHFVIAGERGTAYPRLAKLAEEKGISNRVEFLGNIGREQKIKLLQRCKVYLQPTRYEGFGLAILEAMSCGAPVVSSPAGAVPEVVGDTALLVDGKSPEAIAMATIRLLDDRELGEELGRRGRNRAETEFPYARRRSEIEIVINNVLRRR